MFDIRSAENSEASLELYDIASATFGPRVVKPSTFFFISPMLADIRDVPLIDVLAASLYSKTLLIPYPATSPITENPFLRRSNLLDRMEVSLEIPPTASCRLSATSSRPSAASVMSSALLLKDLRA